MKWVADWAVEASPIIALIWAAILFAVSAQRFFAYFRSGVNVVAWSEWIILAAGGSVFAIAAAVLAYLCGRWAFG